ncbi:DUF6233 domain-containing protein [Streptomyces flavochromogenes]|uniref:DUF6233 domain-containing protein n=1 Tax=Streptomyces flavochromogenes TaxID=68199 RepID=A0ABW6Y3E1_9ACTN
MSFLREGGRPVADSIHIGDCSLAARHRKPLSREEARRALTDGGMRACEICRPTPNSASSTDLPDQCVGSRRARSAAS